MADLRLDIREGAFAQRKNGFPVVPGKPDESLLIKRIYSDNPAFRMPPVFSHRTLTPEQKETLRKWIEQGAKWEQHWAFVPPKKLAPPAVKNSAWPRSDIDRFILAKLEAHGLQPAPEADRYTLIRRVTLDLTGLPPTPAEVDGFVKDKSPNAYEKVVDRLLASPRYGEQRAHYWLDAARYADTNGLHFDNYREMWPYRDWVINAFNANMPFDRFTVEQLAGDLLPKPTLDQKIASGFQRCNETTDEGGVILPEVEAMYAKDRADTTGTVFLGLTVGCATCHDHKFDPISQKDYYSLTSFFRNTTQPVMDLNVEDTPPTIWVPAKQDRTRWQQLIAQRTILMQNFTTDRNRAIQQISSWLEGFRASALRWKPESQVLGVTASDHITVERASRTDTLALPEDVEVEDAPALGGQALRFHPNTKVTFAGVPAIDSDKSFSIATWFYLPDAKEDATIASQYETSKDPKTGDEKRRGWWLRIDRGNLGLYDHAPSVYLRGADGKGISARPIPEFKFKPNSWYHLVITYDGTRQQRGISMYVNGQPVTVVGRPEDDPQLGPAMAVNAPIALGVDDKHGFDHGGVADFRILNTVAGPEDAYTIFVASRAAAAARKQVAEMTDDDRLSIANLYARIANPETQRLTAQLRETDAELYAIRRRSATTEIMQERTDTQPVAHVLYRGQYDQMREEVHPNTPSVLPPMTQAMPRNRLGLAMWIIDPGNPLTARVTVNRFWQELFGTGIVRTVEDFGSQGEPPSHPELLDWLAVDFRESGWDVKRLLKEMVMSATYRQSAATTPQKTTIDPLNRLLARGPRFRMDAEMVRDYALFASGLLRPQIGGASAKPYQPSRIWETVAMEQSNTRVYSQDGGDNLYRRSLYTFWKRAAPPPSMDIFNAPSRETCTVRRERTDTPLQALVTMNDVQFVEAGRVLAQNALAKNRHLDRELTFMSERVLSRPLEKQEMEILSKSYEDFLDYYRASPEDAQKLSKTGASPVNPKLPEAKLAALTMVANEMLNLDEALVK